MRCLILHNQTHTLRKYKSFSQMGADKMFLADLRRFLSALISEKEFALISEKEFELISEKVFELISEKAFALISEKAFALISEKVFELISEKIFINYDRK